MDEADWSVQYATNKGFAEDLTEGKFSFPIVHAVRADTSNRQVLSQSFSARLHVQPLSATQHRCAPEASNNADPESAYNFVPPESHEIVRLHTAGAAQAREANVRRNR